MNSKLKKTGLALAAAALLGLSACSKSRDEYREASVSELYHFASGFLESKQYKFAAAAFDEVERQHPYSVWARRAQLMAAYSNYQANNYEEAILATERFLALHPGNRDAVYARYLKAMCYYEQISDVGRDQKITEQALTAFNEVILRHPNTEYARDARLKIDLTRDHLAGKEMEIGRFYLKQRAPLAAINRFRTVIADFQNTTHVPEALHRLTEAYLMLGVTPEAQTAAAVLGHNYPGSNWYRYSYALLKGKGLEPEKKEGSWLSRIF